MSILLINASPRNNKNCAFIQREIEKELKESNIDYECINIGKMNINYCNACGYCDKTGICCIKDDMTDLYSKINESRGSIVISPVYFDCVPAKLKTLIDRTQAFYASKYVLKKPTIDRDKYRTGMYIAVGGSKPYPSQFTGGNIVIDFFFRCINTKYLYKKYFHSCDEISVNLNADYIEEIKNITYEFIKDVKEN